MEIPYEVKIAAMETLLLVQDSELLYLGEYSKKSAFWVKYPDDRFLGYPPVFLWDESTASVTEIDGEDAAKIIARFL